MTKTIQAPNYCLVIKMLEEQRLYIQSIYVFKENLNISNNSRGNLVANYQITKSCLNCQGKKKELYSINQSVKVSTQENTRFPSEMQLDMSYLRGSLVQKVNVFSVGFCFYLIFWTENFYKWHWILSTVSGMPLDICDEKMFLKKFLFWLKR